MFFFFFFFNDTATTEIYTLSLHDALPICRRARGDDADDLRNQWAGEEHHLPGGKQRNLHLRRSEEHTSELQSQSNLVCRLLLEKKKKKNKKKDTKKKQYKTTNQHKHKEIT